MSLLFRDSWLPASIAVLIGLGLRVVLIFATPVQGDSTAGRLSSYNDEAAHASYSHYVMTFHRLPPHVETVQGPGAMERGHYENYQPPAYYLLHAATADVLGLDDQESLTRVGRWLSLLLSAALFAFFVLIAREARLTAVQTAAGIVFIALNGVFLRFTTVASNDVLFWICVGGLFLSALRLQRETVSAADWLSFVLFAAVGLYTKLTTLLLLPLALLPLLDARRYRRLLIGLASAGIIVLLSFPVWIRNLNEFGSLIPLEAGFGSSACRIPGLPFVAFAVRSFVFPWSELWHGVAGSVLLILPMAVAAYMLYRNRPRRISGSAVFTYGFLLAVFAFLWLNFRYDQAEARYLFAAWPSLAITASRACASLRDLWLLLALLLLPLALFLI